MKPVNYEDYSELQKEIANVKILFILLYPDSETN